MNNLVELYSIVSHRYRGCLSASSARLFCRRLTQSHCRYYLLFCVYVGI